jgi:hypothetical protein
LAVERYSKCPAQIASEQLIASVERGKSSGERREATRKRRVILKMDGKKRNRCPGIFYYSRSLLASQASNLPVFSKIEAILVGN